MHRGRDAMGKGFLYCAVMLVLTIGEARDPARSQASFPWPPELSARPSDQPAAPAEGKGAASASSVPQAGIKPRVPPGPDVAGNWKGELTQIGESAPYKL